jgi:prepilin-type N-terminal cleavage/methylation domain-containing protein
MMRRPAGFTLLEVLTALVVLGLVLGALTGMLRLVLGVAVRQTDRADALAEAAPVREYLEALIGDARPAGFDGGADRLTLVAPLGAAYADVYGLQRLRIGLEGTSLRLQWSGLDDPQARGSTVLLPDLARLQLRYYGSAPAADPPAWHTRWQSTAVPAVIGISWTVRGHAPAPELLIAPRVTGIAAPPQ